MDTEELSFALPPVPAVRIEDIIGTHNSGAGVPTYSPKGFWDYLYFDTTGLALYIYNKTWKVIGTTFASILTAANTIQTYTPISGGTATLDLSKGNIHHITMPAGNITIALSNVTAGQCFIIRILQDSSGSRTVTWFTTIKWAGGSAPTLTTTASKIDTFGFEATGTTTFDGFIVGQNI